MNYIKNKRDMAVYAPIYKDTYYTSTANSLGYKIYANGSSLIYSGKAFKMPNETNLKININKICQDYLSQDFDAIINGNSTMRNYLASLSFVLKNDSDTTLETYVFLYCWDYGYTWNRGSSSVLSNPVNGEYISGQLRPKTTVASSTGSSVNAVNTSANTGSYNKVVCGDYVLYYVNARGGWDAFAFTGKCRKTDSITQHQFNRAFDNNTLEFESGRYISEITTSYDLNTGILTEAQAANFAHNLIGSNLCYLANITEGWVKPAVITDSQAVYKLDGDEDVITYALKVKESQSKIRQ